MLAWKPSSKIAVATLKQARILPCLISHSTWHTWMRRRDHLSRLKRKLMVSQLYLSRMWNLPASLMSSCKPKRSLSSREKAWWRGIAQRDCPRYRHRIGSTTESITIIKEGLPWASFMSIRSLTNCSRSLIVSQTWCLCTGKPFQRLCQPSKSEAALNYSQRQSWLCHWVI